MTAAAALQSIGATDALHNLLRLVEREHQRIADLEARVEELERQHIADLKARVEALTAVAERNEAIARVQRGRIDSLESRGS